MKITPGPTPRLRLKTPRIECSFHDEPALQFAAQGVHVDPKSGLARFGPFSVNDPRFHRSTVRIGVIGTGEMVELVNQWFEQCSRAIPAEDGSPDFPGFSHQTGFACRVLVDDGWNEILTRNDLQSLKRLSPGKLKFEAALELLEEKVRLIAEKDAPPDLIVFAVPPALYDELRTCNYRYQLDDGSGTMIHRDLRRAFKARAMRYRIPTQIVLKRTLVGGRGVDHASNRAWNFFAGLYFKAGGIPWVLRDITPGTCFVGVSFYHQISDSGKAMRTSLAQAFDEYGNGLVLRGHKFPWDAERDGRTPHLTAEGAHTLITMVLDRYKREMKREPVRVVVHKSSQFWPEEREGFEEALKSVSTYDLVAVRSTSHVRLLRAGLYPPLRGTAFRIGETDYLYTTGYVPALEGYPHGHVPSPLQLTDHIGSDSSPDHLLKEILALTKMNWNSTDLGGHKPITLRFSEWVGDILREVPDDEEPHPSFRFYM